MDRLVDTICFHARALKRRAGASRSIYFCLNSGRCGSMSLVRLLQRNGVRNCYHELSPDLHREGIDYFHHRTEVETVARALRRTRRGVFLEANNRLFALAYPIKLAFPQARFIFLYRNGRDVVRSGLQRRWHQSGDPFADVRLYAERDEPAFVKVCRYWADVNTRILQDLQSMSCTYLPLRFEDLVRREGVAKLEDFLEVSLSRCGTVPMANHTTDWSVPASDRWPAEWCRTFEQICGPMMRRLGYSDSSFQVI